MREKQFLVLQSLGDAPGLRMFGGCLESGLDNLMIKQCLLIILIKDFRQLFCFSHVQGQKGSHASVGT